MAFEIGIVGFGRMGTEIAANRVSEGASGWKGPYAQKVSDQKENLKLINEDAHGSPLDKSNM